MCLVERMESEKKKISFIWLRKKYEMIENIIYIHLLSCFYYISKKFISLKEKKKTNFWGKKAYCSILFLKKNREG